jgi:hypothetical protein
MKTIETSDTIFTTPFIPRPFTQKLQQKEDCQQLPKHENNY